MLAVSETSIKPTTDLLIHSSMPFVSMFIFMRMSSINGSRDVHFPASLALIILFPSTLHSIPHSIDHHTPIASNVLGPPPPPPLAPLTFGPSNRVLAPGTGFLPTLNGGTIIARGNVSLDCVLAPAESVTPRCSSGRSSAFEPCDEVDPLLF